MPFRLLWLKLVAMTQTRQVLTAREVEIIRRMKRVLKLPVTKIAKGVGRNKCTIHKVLKPGYKVGKRGRRDLLTKKDVNLLVRTIKAMIKKAAARYEVTMSMIRKRTKIKAGEQCIRKALRIRGIRFRRLRSKPKLTTADVRARREFAEKYKGKSRSWWQKNVHLYIDLKNFAVYHHHLARAYAAMREIHGAYRTLAQGLDEAYVVAPKALRYNSGARPVKIAGGVGKGRVRLWTDIGKKWNASVASDLYLNDIHTALRRACPGKRKYLMLEDNDPTGFKSKAGERAKKATKIEVLRIPKRSPDLSVMDYAIWKAIVRTMRLQERRFKKSKRETRDEYIRRLRGAAMALKPAFINKAIGNMRERCQRLYAAKGKHFEEGGKNMFV